MTISKCFSLWVSYSHQGRPHR